MYPFIYVYTFSYTYFYAYAFVEIQLCRSIDLFIMYNFLSPHTYEDLTLLVHDFSNTLTILNDGARQPLGHVFEICREPTLRDRSSNRNQEFCKTHVQHFDSTDNAMREEI